MSPSSECPSGRETWHRVKAGAADADANRLGRFKAQLAQIQRLNEGVNDANRIIFVDPIIEASRQQRSYSPQRPEGRCFGCAASNAASVTAGQPPLGTCPSH